jgi:cyclophilin family peptidyl-prolyl cis-trans isomerase
LYSLRDRPLVMRVLILVLALAVAQRPATLFTTPLSLAEMQNKQAVVETTLGSFVIDLLPQAAPNHVGYLITLARDGAYDGTTFHRAIRLGLIQGGDPTSKDPAKRDQYGMGGLNMLKSEVNTERHTRGAVSAVLAGSNPDSAGSQFFVCVADQPALDGKYTVFGRVSEGILVVQKISEAEVDEAGLVRDRIEIRRVTIRDKPAPEADPFSTETVQQLSAIRATLETSMGDIGVSFFPDKAPEHVRNFLRLASAGVYDGMGVHRVARGFVIQTGFLPTRGEALNERQQRFVRTLSPEFNDTRHVKGILSMARGSDPASASTSFFIVTADAPALDGQYTAFGRVESGLDVVAKIEADDFNGATPRTRIDLRIALFSLKYYF